METVTLTLQDPIDFGNERHETLEFQPLKAKHMRKMKGDPSFSDFLDLVGASTGLLKPVVDELSIRDATAAVKIISDFFTSGQENS